MFKLIVRYIYSFLGLIAIIGGVWAFYDQLVSIDDYSLTLTLKSKEKLIENNHHTPGLTMSYNGVEVDSLYLTKIQLKNTGKRALTKDFIYQPVQISVGGSNQILQINTKNSLLTHTKNSITFKWNLFNPTEAMEVLIFSTQPVKLNINQKIKEISSINFVEEIENPSIAQRFESINILWYLIMIFALIITIDALLLIRNDMKLVRIFNFLTSLPTLKSIKREDFLSELSNLYQDYYNSTPLLFIKPDELIKLISENITQSKNITDDELIKAEDEGFNYVRYANLYSIRSNNIIAGPLLFILSFIGILILLFIK